MGNAELSLYRQSSDVVCRKVAGETLLVPIRGTVAEMDRLFVLEGCAVELWSALKEPVGCEALSALLAERYEVGADCARADVKSLLEELSSRGLVEATEDGVTP